MIQNLKSKIQERVQFQRFLQYSWDILFFDLGSLVRPSWSAAVSEVGWILDLGSKSTLFPGCRPWPINWIDPARIPIPPLCGSKSLFREAPVSAIWRTVLYLSPSQLREISFLFGRSAAVGASISLRRTGSLKALLSGGTRPVRGSVIAVAASGCIWIMDPRSVGKRIFSNRP